MARWIVTGVMDVSVSVKVEADTREEALERAYDEGPGGLCTSCSGMGQSWGMDSGDVTLDEATKVED